jgi:hypothetical protein
MQSRRGHIPDATRLPQLLTAFDCPDLIASVDDISYGRAGDLIACSVQLPHAREARKVYFEADLDTTGVR